MSKIPDHGKADFEAGLEETTTASRQKMDVSTIIRIAAKQAHSHPSSSDQSDLPHRINWEVKEFLDTELDGYEILEQVGHGGQAIVFKAIQQSTNRTVALKVLFEGPFASTRQQMRFLREIALVSRLSHPNIVPIYDSGVVAGHHWFSMEYVSRSLPLDDYVLLHRPSIPEVLGMFEQAVRAIGVAHQQGIIHRDVKPSNILVDAHGVPHVADFGLAKDLLDRSDSEELSIAGQVLGTLPYLSPEQAAESQTQGVSVLTDIYSLGVVLYKLITGQFPYPVDGGPADVRHSILQCEPLSLLAARNTFVDDALLPSGTIQDDLEQVVFKALRKDQERRYQSASAFADDIVRLLNREAVEAKADNKMYIMRRFLWKHRTKVFLVSAFLLLLLVSLLATTVLWRRAEKVSFMSQLVWDTSALNKLGSVARDESRYDDAIEMFEKSIEISHLTRIPNPTLLRNRFDACQRWAWLCYERGALERGDRLCTAGVKIAEDMHNSHPGDLLWQRYLGAAHELQGRGRYAHSEWTGARKHFEQAAVQYKAVLNQEPAELSVMEGLAHACRWQGRSCLKLGRFDEAYGCFVDAKKLCLVLLENSSESAIPVLNLIRCDMMLARCLLNYQTSEDNTKAEVLLQDAQRRLDALNESGRHDGLHKPVERLGNDIRAYLNVIQKRAVKSSDSGKGSK